MSEVERLLADCALLLLKYLIRSVEALRRCKMQDLLDQLQKLLLAEDIGG